MRRPEGFTLLEVMVAVAILAITFTALLTSESGAIRAAARAEKMSIATSLARCKMGEIEEVVWKEGLPAVSKNDTDGCCEGGEIEGFECEWEIATIQLPETMFAPEEGEAEGEDTEGEDPGAALGGIPLGLGTGLGGGLDDGAALGAALGGMDSMAISLAYPVLKPFFESQIRSAVVTVRWREGQAQREFELVQYLVADEGVAPDDGTAAEQAATGTGTGSAAGAGSGVLGGLGNLLGGSR